MDMLAKGALLLFVLAAWGLAPLPAQPEIARSRGERGGTTEPRNLEFESPGKGAPGPIQPVEGEETVHPPPGRDDPEQFYRKPPRKPKQLRQVYV